MVYINADGTINHGPRPWGIRRITDLLWTFVDSVVLFFQTLVPISFESNNRAVGYRSNNNNNAMGYRSGRRSDGNRSTRFRTMSDISPPVVFGGGCAGGACGR